MEEAVDRLLTTAPVVELSDPPLATSLACTTLPAVAALVEHDDVSAPAQLHGVVSDSMDSDPESVESDSTSVLPSSLVVSVSLSSLFSPSFVVSSVILIVVLVFSSLPVWIE